MAKPFRVSARAASRFFRDLAVPHPTLRCMSSPAHSSPWCRRKNSRPTSGFTASWCQKLGGCATGYQGCIRATRRKLREIQPDIVHGAGTERDCAISAVFSGFPNVVTIHGNMAELARLFKAPIGSFHWLAARLENFTLRRTAGVLCNSTYTEGLVRSHARKTWLLPHAVRSAFFEPIPEAASRPCVLLNAGYIVPRKRQLELLDVAEALHQRGLKFEFRFIGFIPPATAVCASLSGENQTADSQRLRPFPRRPAGK